MKTFLLVVLQSIALVLVSLPASARLAEGPSRILNIGDSHSAQEYGKTLYGLLRAEGHRVRNYGCVGATVNNYVNGGYTCWNVRHGVKMGSVVNDRQRTYRIRTVDELLSDFDPQVVIVSLGGNNVNHPEQISSLVDKLDGRACYWVGPAWGPYGAPHDPDENERLFRRFYAQLAQLKGQCRVFDSLRHTDHDFCPGDVNRRFCRSHCRDRSRCRYHLNEYPGGAKVAVDWAKAVHTFIRTDQEPPVSTLLKPVRAGVVGELLALHRRQLSVLGAWLVPAMATEAHQPVRRFDDRPHVAASGASWLSW